MVAYVPCGGAQRGEIVCQNLPERADVANAIVDRLSSGVDADREMELYKSAGIDLSSIEKLKLVLRMNAREIVNVFRQLLPSSCTETVTAAFPQRDNKYVMDATTPAVRAMLALTDAQIDCWSTWGSAVVCLRLAEKRCPE